ncbi:MULTISPECIES: energy-coupling factor ABC transporter permease [unclassified Bradyrhizobium]|uniref:energy-coupling factor ABC transporter permease n=1 Tax=unclassified Bradyrhizobium TaxID=2631580 RepID=UPI001FFA8B05|nr:MULTISPECIES: energy-coupling factor ABC transporter permease [unclassified Bradyrhizobium]MCK1715374.1 energy-coupling factor ABC transporter permease [Bradyrhizobium sp. 143]MCK1727096.1 energy-coupling factor ABC transporter permease [Bradyrhizobium sp. 142]
MHIEPGVVTGAKLVLSYATGIATGGVALKLAAETMREQGIGSFAARTVATTGLVFTFFEILPHFPVGVSEVHFILGSTLFLLFGAAPAAFGLALGLLFQGMFFEPADLPQYGMNVTTLLVPLFAIQAIAMRIIPRNTAYVDLRYRQALVLSTTYQSGVIAWVAFWALYGSGFGATNLANIATFAASYALVIVIEPLADLAVLALAKSLRGVTAPGFVTPRLHNAA